MLTMKGKYGLKAAIHLAGIAPGEVAQSSDISETCGISKKFLDAILADMRVAGFVMTRKGRHGGYALIRPAEDIMVGHLIRALDGPLAPIPCARRTGYAPCQDCADENRCAVRLLMLEVREAIVSVLDTRSLAQLRDVADGKIPETEDEGYGISALLAG
ncbi:Rrf2 family transcriptional regulator [Rhodobacter sp. 24-YEA-8]|uniref:RrF2 family transcriptional regulator n=1 Tax=Rhodobacter sp. 24-YEA-8 TaxID=1884310 RepID=UPI000895DBD9|nr:Rrf2 family transcriptional regulator [Rhodobacter sp. 24-YEA-8]SED88224.1 transcriptional regulator, BadM/Rrf2 family [Rhodobacter sp. 24-YEA-8]